MEKNTVLPILIPIEQENFWAQIRAIIQEEISKNQKEKTSENLVTETPGLAYKPLFKINEVCSIFKVSRPTIYDWIKHGKLKPRKVRSRLYFLWNDIQAMIEA